ncbi:MAG: thioredoxin [Anaerolinea sp.]|nr:thioredoxin [Anaerolinea sp.]MCC6975835.1 thioredoxin [Anaerolineae bacterium]CAG1012976.1 Thioredoxin [Anaerolineae bacterium]
MGKHTFEVTDESFEQEVLNSEQPVLIDFWAEWCQPCKMIAPHVDEIAAKFEGKLRVGKLDVDTSPDSPSTYGIQGIPTLLLFKGGAVVHRIVGYRTKDKLEAELAKFVELEKA